MAQQASIIRLSFLKAKWVLLQFGNDISRRELWEFVLIMAREKETYKLFRRIPKWIDGFKETSPPFYWTFKIGSWKAQYNINVFFFSFCFRFDTLFFGRATFCEIFLQNEMAQTNNKCSIFSKMPNLWCQARDITQTMKAKTQTTNITMEIIATVI